MQKVPRIRPAVTKRIIKGHCIETIPIGTPLEVKDYGTSNYYIVHSEDFGVTHVWGDEIEFKD